MIRNTLKRMLAVFVALLVISTAHAQEARTDWLDIELGKSIVLETPANARAIAITNPAIADVQTLGAGNKIQVQGKAVGSTDLIVQLSTGAPIIYEITVHQDLTDLIRRVDGLVEGEPPQVYPLQDRIVVQGPVDDLDTLEAIAGVARIYDDNFVNLMTVDGDHQVQLEVIFAEVSRSAVRSLGLQALWDDGNMGFQMTTPATALAEGITHPNPLATRISNGIVGTSGAGMFNFLGYVSSIDLGATLSILSDYRMGKILAQPTLVALSGQQAEFLAGGQIALPQPSGQGNISITFKDYGIKLVFVPTVLGGNVIDLRVYIEISEPDYGNAARLVGVEVPGFVSRKTKSHLRLDSGMTFAMAGLLSERMSYNRAEVPGLGRIPIIGTLFRYTSHERDESELVIFVTPRLVRPLGPGEVPAPPGTTENNNPSDVELFLLGLDHRPGSREADPTGDVGLVR
ncbi:MAG: pilus assembly protein N-terminal domain-containing protein [Proteobacteria bacterium]|nr:pilus assembly protein N-terminal domain-containing protein [Pseudomonadota bacterium]